MSTKGEGKKREPKAAPASNGASKEQSAAPTDAPKQDRRDAGNGPAGDKGKRASNSKGGRTEGGRPGALPMIPMPDVKERDAQVEVIMAEFNNLKKERDDIRKKITDLKDASKGGNDERQKIRLELNKIRDEFAKVRAERDAILNEQKAANAAVEAKQAEERKAKETLGKFTSVEAIDEEVNRIEKRMTTGNFTAKEEKDMLREMDKLRLSKKSVTALKAKVDDVTKAKEQRKEIEGRLTEKRAACDEVAKRMNNVRDALTVLDGKDKEGPGAAIPALTKRAEELNKQLDALLEKKAAAYEEFKKKMEDFRVALEEKRRLEKERRDAEQEKRQQEQEEREKAQAERRRLAEEEEMKKKPWEMEIGMCDMLIGYLERLVKTGSGAATGAASASANATATKRSNSDFSNLKPLTRNEDDDYINLGKKQAKAAPAKKEAAPKETASTLLLSHTLDIIGSFAQIGLVPPKTAGDVDKSIGELKSKRAYYDVLPRAPKGAAAVVEEQNGAATSAAPRSKKEKDASGPPPSTQDASSFPHLPGSKSPLESNEPKLWGPKASEAATAAPEVAEDEE